MFVGLALVALISTPIVILVRYIILKKDFREFKDEQSKVVDTLLADTLNTRAELALTRKRFNDYVSNHPPKGLKDPDEIPEIYINKSLEHFSPDQLSYAELEQCMNYFIDTYHKKATLK